MDNMGVYMGGYIRVILGVYSSYIGIMEDKMETTIDYIGAI